MSDGESVQPPRSPFADLRVIELGSFVSVPWAGRILADLGCDVIKVEPPEGDVSRRYGPFPNDEFDPEESGLFLYLNANKRGVVLDWRTADGHGTLLELVGSADVLLVDLPPREQEELGLTYAHLEGRNPRLVVTSVTPFGLSGPYAHRRAYDINISAAAGVSFGIGEPGRAPLVLPLFQCSFQGGGAAAAATLTAVLARDMVTGRGQQVEVAVEEVLAAQHAGRALPTFIYRGITGARSGRRPRYGLYPQTVMPCKDGYVAFSAPQLQQWIRFVKVIGEPEWTKLPRYRDRRAMAEEYPDEVDALLLPWFMERTKEEILRTALEHELPFAPFLTGSDILSHPHFVERKSIVDFSGAGKRYWGPGPQFRMSRLPIRFRRRAPRLGEHTIEVLSEIRRTWSDVTTDGSFAVSD
jgi:crotonobetainyl-CoA:carnitine CoA-transferase CaiB-like acyl-CoA transferase